jgi:hypothetical protein
MRARAFGTRDLMWLIAAFAVGLFVNRNSWPYTPPTIWWNLPPSVPPRLRAYFAIQVALGIVMPHAVSLTLAMALIRRRRPRPSLRRIARQPGAVACSLAGSCVLIISGWVAANMSLGGEARLRIEDISWSVSTGTTRLNDLQGPLWEKSFLAYADRIGFAVGGGWLCLLMGGRWRPESGWIDAVGRALGWFWIGSAIVIWLCVWLT